MSNLLKVIRERHSARVPFDRKRPVPSTALEQILEAARWAPTAHNMQNFEIVVVDDPVLIDQLGDIPTEMSEAFIRENFQQLSFSEEELRARKVGILATMFPPSWRTATPDMEAIARERGRGSLHDTIHDSPCLLVFTYDPTRRAPASEGDVLGLISLGCALENAWLMAESLGVGLQIMSVFSGSKVERAVKELLAIPESLQIAFAARLGYPRDAAARAKSPRVRRDVKDLAHHNRFGKHGIG